MKPNNPKNNLIKSTSRRENNSNSISPRKGKANNFFDTKIKTDTNFRLTKNTVNAKNINSLNYFSRDNLTQEDELYRGKLEYNKIVQELNNLKVAYSKLDENNKENRAVIKEILGSLNSNYKKGETLEENGVLGKNGILNINKENYLKMKNVC